MILNHLYFVTPYLSLLGNIEGLSEVHIEKIEMKFKVRLPDSYKEFLKYFGRESGNLLGSYLVEEHKLLGNKESALYASVDELDNKSVKIKDTYFFFGQWQGYVFYFFDCSGNSEDPPVYILTDSPKIEKYKNSFTEFIFEEGIKPLIQNNENFT